MAKDIFEKISAAVNALKSSAYSGYSAWPYSRACRELLVLEGLVTQLEGGLEDIWLTEALTGFKEKVILAINDGDAVEVQAKLFHSGFLNFLREVRRPTCLIALPRLIEAYQKAESIAKEEKRKQRFSRRTQYLKLLHRRLLAKEHEEITGEIPL